jgi:hypothetical protein
VNRYGNAYLKVSAELKLKENIANNETSCGQKLNQAMWLVEAESKAMKQIKAGSKLHLYYSMLHTPYYCMICVVVIVSQHSGLLLPQLPVS